MRAEISAIGQVEESGIPRRYLGDTSEIRILDKVIRLGITMWSYPHVIHSLISDF